MNKNTVHGDTSALTPGGVRIGSPALTSRSFKENDFVKVGDFLHRVVQIALAIQEQCGSKLLKDFLVACNGNPDLENLKREITEFAQQFPMPGFDPSTIKRLD